MKCHVTAFNQDGEYALETQRTLVDFGDYTLMSSPDFPLWWATLDSGVAPCADHPGPGCVDAKNVNQHAGHKWDGGIPLNVQVQLQVQMACAGCQWASAAALIGGSRFVWDDLPRNDRFIACAYQLTVEHWERVRAGEPPPATDGDGDTLRELYAKRVEGKVVRLDSEAVEEIHAWEECKSLARTAKASADAAKVRLLEAARDADTLLLPDGTRYSVKTIALAAHQRKASKRVDIRKLKG